MTRFKAGLIYCGFGALFAVVFTVMLGVISAAMIGVPSGIFFGVLGGVLLAFESPYIATELSPYIMLFGGLFACFGSAFLGLLSVKLGFLTGRLYKAVRKRCDRMRGWR